MDTTIIVTLIAALSTLAGASVSGYIAFRVSRSQGDTQVTINRSQLSENRAMEMRQIRRDAYVQFLNRLGETEQVFDRTWMSYPPQAENELDNFMLAPMNAASDLRQARNLVTLEGPHGIGGMAIAISVQFQEECLVIAANASQAPKDKQLAASATEAFTAVRHQRDARKILFIKAAQEDLNEVISPVTRGDTPDHQG